jgi:hypothetical protein
VLYPVPDVTGGVEDALRLVRELAPVGAARPPD